MATVIVFEDYSQAICEFDIKDDKLIIECCMNSAEPAGASLYAHDDSGACMLLGSLVTDDSRLKKSYPLSFVVDSGLDPFRIWYFSIVFSNGDEKISCRLELPDTALTSAHRVLYNLRRDGNSESGSAEIYISKIREKINTLPQKELSAFGSHVWHSVDDIKCTFYVSAFEHIIFNSVFVRAFSQSGEWFISTTEDKNVFAVCIYSSDMLPNPMSCVADCEISERCGSGSYHMVYVGLYDDGQYFCKPEKW